VSGIADEKVPPETPSKSPEASETSPAEIDIELCLVVPTYNEAGNVDEVIRRVRQALAGVNWEIIFVDDDSPDGTADRVRMIARQDRRVRCIQRLGRRGLSGACVEGLLATAAPYLAVMDADLQHDETCLPRMLQLLRTGTVDLVVGSRYMTGGGVGEWNATRSSMSRLATTVSRTVNKQDVSDPMSGFFMMRREVLDASARSLSSLGFKILLDLIATSPGRLRIAEVPYTLRLRSVGESKLHAVVVWEFGVLLADKLLGRYLPVRFLLTAVLAGLGVAVHLVTAWILLRLLGATFAVSQAVAAVATLIFAYWVQNLLTYRAPTLPSWRWAGGLAVFILACTPGAIANVALARNLFEHGTHWLPAVLAGVFVGMVWNFAIAHVYTWGRAK
jgi:dolichol-phosphate mannosyltransferase